MSTPDLSKPGRPKRVKSGCVTCRIRKVKCDEALPACNRCTSTGRKCDGYSTLHFSRGELHAASSSSSSSTSRHSPPSSDIVGLLPRLMTDPTFCDVLEARYFQFFRLKTVRGSNSLVGGSFWDRVVLQACHFEPTVKHAVLALTALHQLSELPDGGEMKKRHRCYAERQHQKALQEARMLVASAKPQDMDRVLIACVVFVCYEGVRGDYAASSVHMHSGRQLILSSRERIRQTSRRNDLREIEQALYRLDIPALSFQDRSSTLNLTLDVYLRTQPVLIVPEFDTVVEARASLVDLVRWLLLVAHPNEDPTSSGGMISTDRCAAELVQCATQLRIWRVHFEKLVKDTTSSASDMLIGMVRVWHTGATAMAEAGFTGPETRYDGLQRHFAELVALAEVVIDKLAKSDNASFSIETGYIDSVWFAASRCRDPAVRRDAIRLLRACQRQEGVWLSSPTAVVAERWMDIEEGGLPLVRQASDVPECRRILRVDTRSDVDGRSVQLQFAMRGEGGKLVFRNEEVRW